MVSPSLRCPLPNCTNCTAIWDLVCWLTFTVSSHLSAAESSYTGLFTMKSCSVLMAADCWEKHAVCLWAWGSSSGRRSFPPFPSSIDPPWLCRSQMKTSRYDLWDVISRGSGGAPPSLHLEREQPAQEHNQFPRVLGPGSVYYHRDNNTSWVYEEHFTLWIKTEEKRTKKYHSWL